MIVKGTGRVVESRPLNAKATGKKFMQAVKVAYMGGTIELQVSEPDPQQLCAKIVAGQSYEIEAEVRPGFGANKIAFELIKVGPPKV